MKNSVKNNKEILYILKWKDLQDVLLSERNPAAKQYIQ